MTTEPHADDITDFRRWQADMIDHCRSYRYTAGDNIDHFDWFSRQAGQGDTPAARHAHLMICAFRDAVAEWADRAAGFTCSVIVSDPKTEHSDAGARIVFTITVGDGVWEQRGAVPLDERGWLTTPEGDPLFTIGLLTIGTIRAVHSSIVASLEGGTA